MTNPTPDQINERLAKFDGWKLIEPYGEGRWPSGTWKSPEGKRYTVRGDESLFPDYMHSLTDALRVVEKLRRDQHSVTIHGDEWYNGGCWCVTIKDPLGKVVGECNDIQKHSKEKSGWDEPSLAAAIALAVYRVLEQEA